MWLIDTSVCLFSIEIVSILCHVSSPVGFPDYSQLFTVLPTRGDYWLLQPIMCGFYDEACGRVMDDVPFSFVLCDCFVNDYFFTICQPVCRHQHHHITPTSPHHTNITWLVHLDSPLASEIGKFSITFLTSVAYWPVTIRYLNNPFFSIGSDIS